MQIIKQNWMKILRDTNKTTITKTMFTDVTNQETYRSLSCENNEIQIPFFTLKLVFLLLFNLK